MLRLVLGFLFCSGVSLANSNDNLEDKTVIKIPVKNRSGSGTLNQVLAEQEDHLVSDKDFHLAPMSAPDQRSDCGFQYTDLKVGASGVIQTPNYPDAYPPDIQCIWWLKGVENTRILIHCDQIETQSCNPEFFDYALFAPDWSWSKYSIACGNNQGKLPLKMVSYATEFSIFFRSSLKDHFQGLHCEYRVIPELLATSTAAPTTSSTSAASSTTANPEDEKAYNGAENCGLSSSSRIVGGNEASPHEFPWLVGISLNETWFCGGSLISPKWVLTAAHCTSGAAYAHVILGAHHLYNSHDQPNYKTLKATKFINHPQYDPTKIANDVALIELPKEITYNEHTRPACLPLRKSIEKDITGTMMVAAGWGKTNDSSSISENLNKLNVRIVTNDECQQTFGNIVQKTTLCSIGLDGNTGTCQGDSGSSLQYPINAGDKWIQVGVVSFGAATGCADDHPNGYTRIAYFLDWISEITGLTFD